MLLHDKRGQISLHPKIKTRTVNTEELLRSYEKQFPSGEKKEKHSLTSKLIPMLGNRVQMAQM